MVFHIGYEYSVSFREVASAPRPSDEIEGFGGVFGKDNLVRGLAADEASDPPPCLFHFLRSLSCDFICAPVHVGVNGFVVVVHSVNDAVRFL